MATFCYRIRSTEKNKLVKVQILFTVGRGNQFYVDSQYLVLLMRGTVSDSPSKAAMPLRTTLPNNRGTN